VLTLPEALSLLSPQLSRHCDFEYFVQIFSNFKFQHKFAEHAKPVLSAEMLLEVTAVLEAEKQLPPETKRNSGRKNEFSK
jgi:hypothetical protein